MSARLSSTLIVGFEPVAAPDSAVLILGSMPSVASLDRGQYYGLPRNAFWPIMAELFGVPADRPYAERLAGLTRNRIALWDVIHTCHRPGSLDAAIDVSTAKANDFPHFFKTHRDIQRVFFNGRKAEQMYERLVLPGLDSQKASLRRATLPSTSPAHAAMRFPEKLQCWAVVKTGARQRSQ